MQCLDSLDSRNKGGYRSPGVDNESCIGRDVHVSDRVVLSVNVVRAFRDHSTFFPDHIEASVEVSPDRPPAIGCDLLQRFRVLNIHPSHAATPTNSSSHVACTVSMRCG